MFTHKLATLYLILVSFTVNCQSVLIPYREGNLWGVSDTLGNIVVKPVYDYVSYEITGSGFLISTKNRRHGIVSNREIIKPVFEKISGSYNFFEADSSINGRTVKYFFNSNGDPLFPKNYTSMSLVDGISHSFDYPRGRPLFHFFWGYDTTGKGGLFCYNVENPKESKLLLEGKKNTEMEIEFRSINRYNKIFIVDYKYILVSYDFKKRKLRVLKFKTDEELEKAENKIKEESKKMKQKPKIIQDSNTKIYIPPKVRISSVYELVDGELFLKSSYENLQNLTYYTTLKKVGFNSKDYSIVINSGHTYKIKEDTSVSYPMYVLYKKNNKQGFIWGDKIIPNIYDSLNLIQCDSFQYFIYGVRDSTGTMKLGTMKPDGTVIIAPEYNEISYKIYSSYYYINVASSYQWIVKKGSKFGIITPKNKILLDFNYDTIFKANNLIHLKKNGLYGVYYSGYADEHFKEPIFLIEPFVSYKILRVVYLPRTNDINTNYFQLFELVDKEGRIIGYANPNGLTYFKD